MSNLSFQNYQNGKTTITYNGITINYYLDPVTEFELHEIDRKTYQRLKSRYKKKHKVPIEDIPDYSRSFLILKLRKKLENGKRKIFYYVTIQNYEIFVDCNVHQLPGRLVEFGSVKLL
jgi:hypothetical protein